MQCLDLQAVYLSSVKFSAVHIVRVLTDIQSRVTEEVTEKSHKFLSGRQK